MKEQNEKSNLLKFSEFLINELQAELPGKDAHIDMAPLLDDLPFRDSKPANNARDSSVMLLIAEHENQIKVLFTLRSLTLSSHGGQISFPGGMIENGETTYQAALRETHEEIDVSANGIEILGSLSKLYVPPSNSVINPVVGRLKQYQSDFNLNYDEVDEVFYVPISRFYDGSIKIKEDWDFKGTKVNVPYWKIHDSTPLWGATAMILNEFLVISRKYFLRNE